MKRIIQNFMISLPFVCAFFLFMGMTEAGSPILPYMTQYWRSVLDGDTPVHQPIAGDSTTFFQVKNAAGTVVPFNVDTTNNQVTIGKTSAAYPFLIKSTDGSDQIEIYHNNGSAFFKITDGSFFFETSEGTDTSTLISVRGKGAGIGAFELRNEDNTNYLNHFCNVGIGKIRVAGTSPTELQLQGPANTKITCFGDATEGETQRFSIYGFGTGSGGKESLDITVEKTTANTVEFEGLDAYNFTGTLKSTNGAQLGDGGVTNYVGIDGSGVLSLNGLAGLQLPHMMQSDSTNQTVGTVNVAQVVTFNTDVHHFGITRTSSSRFTILKEASYLIAISALCDTAVANKDIEVWLRINGSDVANSNTIVHLGTAAETTLAVTYIKHFDVGDYFEFWMTGENTGCRLLATAAVTTGGEERPACPSIIMTCNYVGVD